MIRIIFKYGFYLLLLVVAYNALKYYALYGYANKLTHDCRSTSEDIADLKRRRAPSWEYEKYVHEKFSCLKEKQNFIESYFFPIPENWINPPPGSFDYEKILEHERQLH